MVLVLDMDTCRKLAISPAVISSAIRHFAF